MNFFGLSSGFFSHPCVILSFKIFLWRGVVLDPSRNIDPGETPRYQELLQSGRVSRILEAILIYKLPQLNRQKIKAMFSLIDLKQTRVYQYALEEGYQEAQLEWVHFLVSLGINSQ